MQIHTSLSPADPIPSAAADVAIVIDVLRATSVATTALQSGAKQILACREIDAARALAASLGPQTLLCGERGCRPIEGFDCGNSPAEYTADRVADRTLILTTTNGTRAIQSASSARTMVLASFLNLSAVVQHVHRFESLHVVCAGTDGQVTGEDVLLAGAIIDGVLLHRTDATDSDAPSPLCDASRIARQFWCGSLPNPDPDTLRKCLENTLGGRNLIRVGYADDLSRCAAIDSGPIIPYRTQLEPATFQVM
ncbi:putative 2-phosphosulfolactate phosphatase [Rubripirellula lacrimiformis]|uniref:Probable 2-phosphosulfolactate phosphatase n=1 Tax=Rubripirellula lacrimiformis TaxID=1930273 RepID=A0A517N6H3_9BACT|nr:2-phosphosulfolactate phosphatase [Rubripirellula lacrimiformis]QDT02730.1 putative 2-phosphosulfolactate phosphatase [Rubripirellula lacrimiformis]